VTSAAFALRVATVAPDGSTLDLFGWLTLANRNAQGWSHVWLQAVAGRIQRQYVQDIAAAAQRLELHCFPLGSTTSDLPTLSPYQRDAEAAFDVVVTASRRLASPMMMAPMLLAPPPPPPPPPSPPEDLGDLKLYRVPEAVDIAPNGQKQVALLDQRQLPFETVYRVHIYPWQATNGVPATIALRMDNEQEAKLGIPLPAGSTSLYQPREGTRLLLGNGTIGDTAKGEKVRLAAGVSDQVLTAQSMDGPVRHVTVTNANPFAVPVEVALALPGTPMQAAPSAPLSRIDGVETWRVTVPPNGTVTLDYSVNTN
jgi:hypothetical protein